MTQDNGVRACPACPSGELERRHSSLWVRALRMLPGLYPRTYQCDKCHRTVVRWRRDAESRFRRA